MFNNWFFAGTKRWCCRCRHTFYILFLSLSLSCSFSLTAALSPSLFLPSTNSRLRNHASRAYVVARSGSSARCSHRSSPLGRTGKRISRLFVLIAPIFVPPRRKARRRDFVAPRGPSPPSFWQKSEWRESSFDPTYAAMIGKGRNMRIYTHICIYNWLNKLEIIEGYKCGEKIEVDDVRRGYVDEAIKNRMMCRYRNGW